jgi:hypothetical protein
MVLFEGENYQRGVKECRALRKWYSDQKQTCNNVPSPKLVQGVYNRIIEVREPVV